MVPLVIFIIILACVVPVFFIWRTMMACVGTYN